MRKRKEKSKVVYSIEVGSCHENISSCLKSENLSGLLHMRIDGALVLALALALSRGTGTGEAIAGLAGLAGPTGDGAPGVAVGAGARLGGGLAGVNRSNGVHSVQVVVEKSSLRERTLKFPQRTHLQRQRLHVPLCWPFAVEPQSLGETVFCHIRSSWTSTEFHCGLESRSSCVSSSGRFTAIASMMMARQ